MVARKRAIVRHRTHTWVPRPRIKWPPERPCRSQSVWATFIGEWEKAMGTEVPSSIYSVSFAA
jgi:hypothetical protein